MIFPSPLFPANKPMLKTPKLSIEGKWRFIGKRVKELINDGWTQVSIEANEQFTLTIVELENRRASPQHIDGFRKSCW